MNARMMSASLAARQRRDYDEEVRETDTLRDTYLFVRCHSWFMGVSAVHVERIVMPSEVQMLPGAPGGTRPGHLGLALCTGRYYSAWDLGLMIEDQPLANTYIMFRLPGPRGTLPMALRTGTCLSVNPLRRSRISLLAPGIFRGRPGACSGAYSTTQVLARSKPIIPVGLILDLEHLWTPDDVAFVTKLLRDAKVAP